MPIIILAALVFLVLVFAAAVKDFLYYRKLYAPEKPEPRKLTTAEIIERLNKVNPAAQKAINNFLKNK